MNTSQPRKRNPRKNLEEKVSVLVTSSPIPSHPSPELILSTIESLHFLGIVPSVRIYVLLDGIRPSLRNRMTRSSYSEYERNLREISSKLNNLQILSRSRWGHISQTLRMGLAQISTDYVLVIQHDMPFVREVDLHSLVDQMDNNRELKHVRFNLRENLPSGADGTYSYRREGRIFDRSSFFSEWSPSHGHATIPLIKTLCWSDNNYLCKTEYLKETVLKPIGKTKLAPEWPMNRVSDKETHRILGTFVYGRPGDPPVIGHLDGRNYEKQVSPRTNPKADRFQMASSPQFGNLFQTLATSMWRLRHDSQIDRVVKRAKRQWGLQ